MTTGQLKNKQMFLLLFTNVLQICSKCHVIHLQMAVSLCNPGYLISLGQLPVCFSTSQREQKAPFQPCGTIPRPSELSTSIFILLFFFSSHPRGPSTMTICGYYCYLFLSSIHKGVLSFNFSSHILLHFSPPHCYDWLPLSFRYPFH